MKNIEVALSAGRHFFRCTFQSLLSFRPSNFAVFVNGLQAISNALQSFEYPIACVDISYFFLVFVLGGAGNDPSSMSVLVMWLGATTKYQSSCLTLITYQGIALSLPPRPPPPPPPPLFPRKPPTPPPPPPPPLITRLVPENRSTPREDDDQHQTNAPRGRAGGSCEADAWSPLRSRRPQGPFLLEPPGFPLRLRLHEARAPHVGIPTLTSFNEN